MSEKLSPISRALVAASYMDAPKARQVLMLICEGGMRETVKPIVNDPGAAHYEKRKKFIDRFHSAITRSLDYARHETLRNIEWHFIDTRRDLVSIKSASQNTGDDEQKPSDRALRTPSPDSSQSKEKKKSLSSRLAFEVAPFGVFLASVLREEQVVTITRAGQALFNEIGNDDTFNLPDKTVENFLKQRANLLANVPDEIHRKIMDAINEGLERGDSRRALMERISGAFDVIQEGRARTIANTETAAAFNFARDKAMREAGVSQKKWLFSQSPLIKEHRPSHVEAGGQTVSIDEPFDVDGVRFMYPSDSSLGAGPEDIINCHCVSIAVA